MKPNELSRTEDRKVTWRFTGQWRIRGEQNRDLCELELERTTTIVRDTVDSRTTTEKFWFAPVTEGEIPP